MHFFRQKKNYQIKKHEIQRLGGIRPDPGKTETGIHCNKQTKWITSNLSQ